MAVYNMLSQLLVNASGRPDSVRRGTPSSHVTRHPIKAAIRNIRGLQHRFKPKRDVLPVIALHTEVSISNLNSDGSEEEDDKIKYSAITFISPGSEQGSELPQPFTGRFPLHLAS